MATNQVKNIKETNMHDSKDGSETLASSVYSTLKGDIITGKLKPGHKLRLQVLKEDYNVGNSPLREALNRLSANGMVMREENKGFKVSTASAEELQELVRTRCWLEETALRESIKNGTDEYDERIVIAVHRLSRVSNKEKSNYSTPEHQDLHRDCLLYTSPSPRDQRGSRMPSSA